MTVRELIKELEKMPQDTEVRVKDSWAYFTEIESVIFMDLNEPHWVAIDGE